MPAPECPSGRFEEQKNRTRAAALPLWTVDSEAPRLERWDLGRRDVALEVIDEKLGSHGGRAKQRSFEHEHGR